MGPGATAEDNEAARDRCPRHPAPRACVETRPDYTPRVQLRRRSIAVLVVAALPLLAASPAPSTAPASGVPASLAAPVRLSWQVVGTAPHDTAAWTEGLLLGPEGQLFESTGLVGQSTVRQVDRTTGEVDHQAALPDPLYGEGLAQVGDTLVQLTWKDGEAIVWDAATLTPTGSFHYTGEGWGLCFDGSRLVQSDGSSQLTLRDPTTFEVLGTVGVTAQGTPVDQLNELECVDGEVWANVWETPYIVRIDPTTGAVTGVLDMRGLIEPDPSLEDPGAVLNGIAHDPATDTFLITGKRWPTMFQVRITE